MSNFFGNHLNRLDAKGRVSVPAPFRTALKKIAGETDGPVSMILRPSHTHACIEAWPVSRFEALGEQVLERYEMFSEDYNALSYAIYGKAQTAETDREGRIQLGEKMAKHAGITDAVLFVGVGTNFQIWEPEAGERNEAALLGTVIEKKLTLSVKGIGVLR
ncbi:division/cell wall cluster transcriptional repressor MraZ [Acidisoma sp. C75]